MTIDPTSPEPHFDNWSAVRLVAGREMQMRLRSKAFRIITLAMVVIIVGLCVAIKLLSGGSGTTVGYLSDAKQAAVELPAVASALGQTVHVTPVADQATGASQVRDGKIDALLSTGADGKLTVLVKKDIDKNLRQAVDVLAGQSALDEQIRALGGSPAKVHAAAATASATVTHLDQPYPYQTQQLIIGIVIGVLIYVSLLMNGQSVAQGVVEEKSSRVVELLLATIRPWQLMAGKVLGIGVVGLVQMVVIGGAGAIAGLTTKVLTISVSAAASTLVWLIVWFLLGFFMYAVIFAGLGALVSRQEDIAGATGPALSFLIIGYVLGVSILPSDPSNSLMEVLSMIPMFAPTVMPMRLAMGGVPGWEAAVSIVLVLALIPALIWLASRIYRNAVLRTGARVKLSQALRAA
jgi:ABC-2 type transport system permease protein